MFDNNIRVPKEFFVKAKKEYHNWHFAFFRELIQNSVDAGAKNIKFKLSDNDNFIFIECHDDGCGMDKDIITNALLSLGGSNKADIEGSIGGFGYAKTLLFFSHEEYSIQTKNWIVKGEGGSYNINQSDNFIKGTSIHVTMNKLDSVSRNSVGDLEYELKRILKHSNIKAKVFINEEQYKPKKTKHKFEYNTPIGKLLFSETHNEYSSSLWLRINGLAMFEHDIYYHNTVHFNGYIELDKKPTDVLTTNRDSLKGSASKEFNSVFSALQNERSSLKNEKILTHVLNEVNQKEIYNVQSEISHVETNLENRYTNASFEQDERILQAAREKSTFSPFSKLIEENKEIKDKFKHIFDNIDTFNYPLNFNIQKGDNKLTDRKINVVLNQSFSIKLAKLWKDVVYSLLQTLDDYFHQEYINDELFYFYGNRRIEIGFVFDKTSEAMNSSNSEKIILLINPISIKEMKKNGDYSVRNIFDLALHELTHIFKQDHNESFVITMDSLKRKYYKKNRLADMKKVGNFTFMK